MLVECICIILIIALMSVIFLRAHRKDFAVTTLPLLILPLLHIFSLALSKPLSGPLPLDGNGITIAIDALGLVISCTAFGFFSNRIASKRSRMGYLICCGGFVTILTWVLISDTLMH